MALRIDWRTSASLLETVLKILAAPMVFVLCVALYYGELPVPFLASLVGSLALGAGLEPLERRATDPRETFLLVALALDIGESEVMNAAAATFLDIGPAFGFAGSYGTYVVFPDSMKLVMVAPMWIGRIEIVSVLILFTPAFWRA